MAFKHLVSALFVAFFSLLTLAPANADPFRIVGFGDSLMAGFGLDAGQSFPEKLEAALRKDGHDVVISNAVGSGRHAAGHPRAWRQ